MVFGLVGLLGCYGVTLILRLMRLGGSVLEPVVWRLWSLRYRLYDYCVVKLGDVGILLMSRRWRVWFVSGRLTEWEPCFPIFLGRLWFMVGMWWVWL